MPELTPNAEPLLLTIDEAARLLSIGKSTLYRLAARGEIPCVKLGTCVRIPRSALLALANPNGKEETG